MSIPEAAHLVLRSGAVAGSGELCVLDMGAPVRIVDLVEALIELQGHIPYEEVEIVFTGIGPGEKLEECLLSEVEAQQMRRVGKLMIRWSEPGPVGVEEDRLEQLRRVVEHCRRAEIRSLLEEMAPGYVAAQPPSPPVEEPPGRPCGGVEGWRSGAAGKAVVQRVQVPPCQWLDSDT